MKIALPLITACALSLSALSPALAGNHGGHGMDDNPRPGRDDNPGRHKGLRPQLTRNLLEFQTMVGVDDPFLAGANPIRGVAGGGFPWVLEGAKGELRDDGKLEVQVKGLVIPATDAPPACGGVACNPVLFFRATLSCLTVDDTGDLVDSTLQTPETATVMIGDPKAGNAKIEAMLDLPSPCIAPIVFVTSPGGAWFAVTGAGSL